MAVEKLGDSNKEVLSERYEVQQELGKKAGRRTLLARDLQTQELVVVKVLSFGDEFEWNDLKLFEREAETLKALSHPAIPSYIDYFELDLPNNKGFALVQSYIPAQSLEAQLKAGRNFSEIEVKQLAKAILEILQYLHERQPPVIHRDIKPSNILLTNRSGNSVGEVSLVDFGSVQTVARRSSTMTVVGTYGYMAPEQFSARATPASDFYSLGTTLIYLVTGQHPADLPQTDLRMEFEQAANISPSFSRWLRRMTEPIASQGFVSAKEAVRSLEQAENTTTTETRESNSRIGKPAGSKVVLTKNADSLEVIIPSIGFFSTFNLSYLLIYGLLLLPLSVLLQVRSTANIYFNVYFIITTIVFFYISLCIYGRKILCLNRRGISLKYELFEIALYHPLPSRRQDIIRLERTKDIYNQPYLTIWAGTRAYKLFTVSPSSLYGFYLFPLSTPELDWIAEEISDWLGLPITRE
jgi:serine/threonine protein kinase